MVSGHLRLPSRLTLSRHARPAHGAGQTPAPSAGPRASLVSSRSRPGLATGVCIPEPSVPTQWLVWPSWRKSSVRRSGAWGGRLAHLPDGAPRSRATLPRRHLEALGLLGPRRRTVKERCFGHTCCSFSGRDQERPPGHRGGAGHLAGARAPCARPRGLHLQRPLRDLSTCSPGVGPGSLRQVALVLELCPGARCSVRVPMGDGVVVVCDVTKPFPVGAVSIATRPSGGWGRLMALAKGHPTPPARRAGIGSGDPLRPGAGSASRPPRPLPRRWPRSGPRVHAAPLGPLGPSPDPLSGDPPPRAGALAPRPLSSVSRATCSVDRCWPMRWRLRLPPLRPRWPRTFQFCSLRPARRLLADGNAGKTWNETTLRRAGPRICLIRLRRFASARF